MKRSKSGPISSSKKDKNINAFAGKPVADIALVSSWDMFYETFVATRIPAHIQTQCAPIDLARFCLSEILTTLNFDPLQPLQVERMHDYGFGLGKTRESKTFKEIVDLFKAGEGLYYLTTQYSDEGLGNGAALELETPLVVLESSEEETVLEVEQGDVADLLQGPALDDEASGEEFSEGSSPLDLDDLRDDFEDSDVLDDEPEYVVPEHQLTAEDVDDRIATLLQSPLSGLVHDATFPLTFPPFDSLVPQQINLWMGSSPKMTSRPDLLKPSVETLGKWVPSGTSSGLHHDHADNLYVLVEGRKRFTLFSPKDALHLYTVGNINQVFENGLIDYVPDKDAPLWRRMRADGAIIGEHARWMLDQTEDPEELQKYEKIINSEIEYEGEVSQEIDPPSFSRIPPALLHIDEVEDSSERAALEALAQSEFPELAGLKKHEVILEKGEMLYLPCGWFHEVTSYATGESPAHIALNWWFVPPTNHLLSLSSAPYIDGYWQQDYDRTLAAIKHRVEGGP